MKTTLEINETVWQYEADKRNAAEDARAAQDQARYDALISHTPEARRASIPLPIPALHLTVEDLVKELRDKEEVRISADQAKQHDAAILAATPEDKARVAKILAQPEPVKDAIRAQVDALPA